MKKFFFAVGSVAALSLSLVSSGAFAQDAPAVSDDEARGTSPESQQGYDIAARSDRSDAGYGDSRVSAVMILKNKAGQETRREFSFRTLERESENVGDKSLVSFDTPKDVEGTSLLSHAKILEPDDQWLYLPALKRVKRISSANKSGAFVGSEFAFEDFTISELNKFTYNYLGQEDLDGAEMDVVERFPRYEKSGYTRQKAWIDTDIFQSRKIEFYDRKGELLKTLSLGDYREYDGVWRAHELTMINHQTGKETVLTYSDYEFRTGLEASDFEQGILNRLR